MPKSVRPGAPPAPAGPVQKAAKLLGTLGRSGAGELDAFLEGIHEEETLAAGAHLSPLDLSNVALTIFLAAHDLTQSLTPQQKTRLRGCTARLIALALEQAVTLHNVASERAERTRARDVAKRELAALCPGVEMQCAHARSLLTKVAPEQVSSRLAAISSPSDLTCELETLASIARDILGGSLANIATRARLYGVDHDFVTDIERLADEHRAVQRRAAEVTLSPSQALAARRAHLATWILVRHVSDTFAAARSLDKTIPPLPPIPRAPAKKPQPPPSFFQSKPGQPGIPAAPQSATFPATRPQPHGGTPPPPTAPAVPPPARASAVPLIIPRDVSRDKR